MSNKQRVREDVVKEYQLQQQKLKDEKISEVGSFESIEKHASLFMKNVATF